MGFFIYQEMKLKKMTCEDWSLITDHNGKI